MRGKADMHASASMGPGSFDPGSDPGDASMTNTAPLQWGRGLSTPEVAEIRFFWKKIPSFNGAGVFRPRKYMEEVRKLKGWKASMGPGSFDPGSHPLARPSDSGSRASMGPGSFDPGSFIEERGIWRNYALQWGRGLSTPEVRGSNRHPNATAGLQWGRGLSTPEVPVAPGNIMSKIRLQWGRGLSTPEVLSLSFCPVSASGFNGAGVFRPRK